MRKATILSSTVVILGWALWLLPPLPASNDPSMDSKEVSELLSQAKRNAAQLERDAARLESFGRSNLTWESHVDQTNLIKQHVNNLGKLLQRLHDARSEASAWQQNAVDQITPLLQEMADSVNASIRHLNDNQDRVHMPEYKAYLKAHYDLASSLSKMISDHVEYGQAKAIYQQLEAELEAPGN
ncbi:MAG: hypothetical protein M1404_01660 [Acidobacteria bacterium]|nr:hypothetical protein [Acidobacteriota bacterium]